MKKKKKVKFAKIAIKKKKTNNEKKKKTVSPALFSKSISHIEIFFFLIIV